MSRYDINESVNGCFDIFSEIDFLRSLKTEELIELPKLMSRLLAEGVEANLFEEIVSLQVTPEIMSLQLRYYDNQRLMLLGKQYTGYSEHFGVTYLFYFFANINKQFPIGKHPFPVNLQDYENYPW